MRFSYSSLATYKKCPRKFRYAYVDQLPRGEAGPAAQRGTEMHKLLEEFVRGNIQELPSPLDHYQSWLEDLRSHECVPEWSFGIDHDYGPCGFDDENTMLRGFVDLVVRDRDDHTLYEWKTGKQYPEHRTQMATYATAYMIHHPEVDDVTVFATYLDQNMHDRVVYQRCMLNDYIGMIRRQIELIKADEIFMPKPHYLCRYCEFSRHNSGPCQF